MRIPANKIITRKDINGFYIKPIRGGFFAVISNFSGCSSVLCCSREEAEKKLAELVEVEKEILAKGLY